MPVGRPTVQPTSATALVIAAIVGGGLTWLVLSAIEGFGRPVPPVPLLAGAVVAVLALATGLAARWTHRTVQVRRQPVEPSRAVGLLLGGKAAMIGGTGLAAGYATLALRALPNLDATLPRERAIAATVVAVLSVVLVLAGRALERACQVPPDNDSHDAPAASPEAGRSPG
ncbi:DUF3180 domain-containing protein [Micropruina sp.]|uniref:DUF3180 domain-containing protein n=1 Tax=Micropruina sp. TaxID=2737536 RepID=UPI0039E323A7